MKSKLFKTGIAALLAISIVHGTDTSKIAWGYEGKDGPQYWGDLSPDYAACKMEKYQSPINIVESQAKKAKHSLKMMQAPQASDIVNNGHTLQINFRQTAPPKATSLSLDGKEYQLMQLHFHTPSENQLNGKKYPAEIHIVYKDAMGNLLVIGIFIKEGQDNKALQTILQNTPQTINQPIQFTDLTLDNLLPSQMSFYEFMGSLTTPPCSGGVTWIVMQHPIQASKAQIQALQKIIKHNARDIQPLHSRTITLTQ